MYQYLVYLRFKFLLKKRILKANIYLYILQVDPALKEKLKQNNVTLESEYEVK